MDAEGDGSRDRQVQRRSQGLRQRRPRGNPRLPRQARQRHQGAQALRPPVQRDQHPLGRGDGRDHHQLRRGPPQKAPAHRQERQARPLQEAHRGNPRGQDPLGRPVPRGHHRVGRRRRGGGRARPRRTLRPAPQVPLLQPRPFEDGCGLDEPRQGGRCDPQVQVVWPGVHRPVQDHPRVHPHGGRPHGHHRSRRRNRSVPGAQLRPPYHNGCGNG